MKILSALTFIDFYKADHRRQYPEGTELVNSNWTPRSDHHISSVAGVTDTGTVLFGLQYAMQELLVAAFNDTFFNRPKSEVVAAYKRRLDNALGKGAVPMDHIEQLHDTGYLPISIRALPEGSVVPKRVPLFVVENTRPEAFWLVNYLETALSCLVWKPCTSASTARRYRQLMTHYAAATGSPTEFVKFQGHDFSCRGMAGYDDALASGAGHLTSFVGTDTVSAIDFLEEYYGANSDTELVGCSVPATEHSVMCMGGQDDEIGTFERLITKTYPAGIVSVVSDTWDFWAVVTEFTLRLKDKIMARDGKLVIRPDSGDPVKIIVGDPDAAPGTPQFKGAVECLWEVFGGTLTEKGYKTLDSHIGLIYGDSITLARCHQILEGLKAKGFAASNVVFGIGSYTYVHVTRDTHGFAMKATAGRVSGVDKEIFKDPKTDGGMKKSARGLVAVHRRGGQFEVEDRVTRAQFEDCALKEVFRDGKILVRTTLAEVRERIANHEKES